MDVHMGRGSLGPSKQIENKDVVNFEALCIVI